VTRSLRDLSAEEREAVIAQIQLEAQEFRWHELNNRAKADLYKEWAERLDLKHQAVKDGVMKGFDAAQGIPPSGEAAVHAGVGQVLRDAAVPYWAEKVPLFGGDAVADFVLGYNSGFLTHVAELESAVTWRAGLMQALWYKSAYFQASGIQAIPTLILFGDASSRRWAQISATCIDHRVLVMPHRFNVDGDPLEPTLAQLLIR
jgi:hypothetical protein